MSSIFNRYFGSYDQIKIDFIQKHSCYSFQRFFFFFDRNFEFHKTSMHRIDYENNKSY